MKNLKIRNKLFVTFGIVIVLFVITIMVSFVGLNQSSSRFKDFYEVGYPVSLKSTDMRRAIQNALKNISYTMLTEDEQKVQEYIATAEEELTNLREGIAFMQKNYNGDKTMVNQAEELLDDSVPYRTQVTELAAQNKNTEAYDVFINSYQPILLQVQDKLIELDKLTEVEADDNYASAAVNQRAVIVILLCISGVALGGMVILALYITKSLTTPISEIESAVTKMAEGNLDVKVSYESQDELGKLSDRIRYFTESLKSIINDEGYLLGEMAKGNFRVSTRARDRYVGEFQAILSSMVEINSSLSNTLLQINQSSDQVASGSEQVSSGAQALSQGATEQASSVEELAASINEISGQVDSNAKNAQQANDSSTMVGSKAEESSQRMQDMLSAMSEISSSSNEIGKIIKTIEDIAFQTNILALNAAVEAARAGEAGKGFAVVADEVRNLASKSAEASKNTAVLIENSLQTVENGRKIADETAQSLMEVVTGVESVAATISQISDASLNQATSIRQVTQGIEQISSVVQTNSATAEESAAASEELSGQAQLLKNLVGRFRLKDGSDTEAVRSGGGKELAEAREMDVLPSFGDKY